MAKKLITDLSSLVIKNWGKNYAYWYVEELIFNEEKKGKKCWNALLRWQNRTHEQIKGNH